MSYYFFTRYFFLFYYLIPLLCINTNLILLNNFYNKYYSLLNTITKYAIKYNQMLEYITPFLNVTNTIL